MRSLFSLLKVKYEPPSSGIPSRPTSISTVSRTGPAGPSTVVTADGSLASRSRSRRSSSGSFQSIHIPSRTDCSVWRAAKVRTRCLHRPTNSAIPYASMSRLLVKPRSRSTLTSTHNPWQSNPFWKRWSWPSIARKR